MAFSSNSSGTNGPLAEINLVPLIDVMLVLMLVFMITAPLLTHSVPLHLPRVSSRPAALPGPSLDLTIDAQGQLWIGDDAVDRPAMLERLRAAAGQTEQPRVQLRADRTTPYEAVAALLSDATIAGLQRLSLVTDPRPGGPP